MATATSGAKATGCASVPATSMRSRSGARDRAAGNWIAVDGAVVRRREGGRVMMMAMTTTVVRDAGATARRAMRARVSAEARRF